MVTHSSILAWRILWTEELGGLQSTGLQESGMTERLNKKVKGSRNGHIQVKNPLCHEDYIEMITKKQQGASQVAQW